MTSSVTAPVTSAGRHDRRIVGAGDGHADGAASRAAVAVESVTVEAFDLGARPAARYSTALAATL